MVHVVESRNPVDCQQAFTFIEPAREFYPDLDAWFSTKVVPGVVNGDDLLLMAKVRGHIAGVILGKSGSSDGEKKLRCVRIAPAFRRMGLGTLLIAEALSRLGCDKPLVSVPEECIHQFSALFVNEFGFSLTRVVHGLYRPGKLEYQFNGATPSHGAPSMSATRIANDGREFPLANNS